LFLAEDAGILGMLSEKGRAGVTVRIALGDPDSAKVIQRDKDEGTGDAMPAEIRNALTLYRSAFAVENVEIRLHQSVLYALTSLTCAGLFDRQTILGSRTA
jgi:hypothetical protein